MIFQAYWMYTLLGGIAPAGEIEWRLGVYTPGTGEGKPDRMRMFIHREILPYCEA